jgi:CrcB protein
VNNLKFGGFMLHLIFIGIGGALGASSRYLIDLYISTNFTIDFPIGTLVANLIGCFIIGVSYKIFHHDIIHTKFNPFIITGFLGALTTFSSYAYKTLYFIENNRELLGITNFFANNFLGILFVYLGAKITDIVIWKYFNHRYLGGRK